MSWREKQGAARFRGVPFFVDSAEQAGGRQTVVHEFPFAKGAPFTEDLGLKPRPFSVEGYVLGDDYEAARDSLLTALETEGSGELVHPYLGTRRVAVVNYRLRQGRDAGGLAQFTIEFQETAAEPEQPTTVPDSGAVVSSATSTARTSVSTRFLSAYNAFGGARSSVLGALNAANNAIGAVADARQLEAQTRAEILRQVSSVSSNAAALLVSPADLLASQVEIFESLAAGLAASALDPVGALLRLFGFDPGAQPSAPTASGILERASFDALTQLVQRLALVEASAVAVGLTFDSYDAAKRTRAAITDLIDQHVESITDDTYPDLMTLRQALVRALPDDAQELPRQLEHTPTTGVCSLVLAHNLYGNLDREADVCARNKLRHPGFVQPGVALEVLSDVSV